MPRISISIDGPTASGKTTLATCLAQSLGLAFLDTGLTYRSLAYALSREPAESLRTRLHSALEHRPVVYDRSGEVVQDHAILLHGEDITEDIWDMSLDGGLKAVAGDSAWREEILGMHQAIVEKHGDVVAVGRDVAMTLLPAARLRIYLTASLAVRRERRRAQYRDRSDRSTAVGPPTQRDEENRAAVRSLPDSIEIDTTYLPASAVSTCALNRLTNASAPGTQRKVR
ncbi:(d)CMP kinase [Streptomyces sp. H51]|uniref:(d)CMP kinase n=1 Tax=Streptomyces sp. H51 TaxID=3111770 RepID=UPI002D784522|nr:(d)CMP kinase [Streptomyces sp. H51]